VSHQRTRSFECPTIDSYSAGKKVCGSTEIMWKCSARSLQLLCLLVLLHALPLEAFHRSHRISILPARQSNLGAPTSIQSPTTSSTSTALNEVSSVPRDDGSGISYSERSRPYRRDLFNYDDWVQHRSSKRFIGRFKNLTKSGVSWALTDEVLLLAAVATFVCSFNAFLVVGYDDFANVHHDPLINFRLPVLSLPFMFFTLTSPALSLLLGKSCKDSLSFLTPFISLTVPKFSKPTPATSAGTKLESLGELSPTVHAPLCDKERLGRMR
jgi:hypothetical protein